MTEPWTLWDVVSVTCSVFVAAQFLTWLAGKMPCTKAADDDGRR